MLSGRSVLNRKQKVVFDIEIVACLLGLAGIFAAVCLCLTFLSSAFPVIKSLFWIICSVVTIAVSPIAFLCARYNPLNIVRHRESYWGKVAFYALGLAVVILAVALYSPIFLVIFRGPP